MKNTKGDEHFLAVVLAVLIVFHLVRRHARFSSPSCYTAMMYKRLLVVVKQTAYEQYSRLKQQGLAPKAVR